MESIFVSCPGCGTKNRIATTRQHQGPRCGKCGEKLDIRRQAVPVERTDADLATFLRQARLPLMLDFYSPSCGPCRSLAPVLVELAGEYLGRVIIAKLDTSRNQLSSGQYGIRGVPTLVFFRAGREVDRLVGLPETAVLRTKLDALARG